MALFPPMLTPAVRLRSEINRVFDDLLGSPFTNRSLFGENMSALEWAPALDVHETDNDFVINVELPGIDPKDVELTIDNNVLTVRGEKRTERKEDDQRRFHIVERTYGQFIRSFRLPKDVDESKIEANFEHGVLTVAIPKTALPQPKRIAIGTGTAKSQTTDTAE